MADRDMAIAAGDMGLNFGLSLFSVLTAPAEGQTQQQAFMAAVENVCAQVRKDNPPALADFIIGQFAAVNYDPRFSFQAAADKWHDNMLYRFLLGRTSEELADTVLAKREKFRLYDVSMSLPELLDRCLKGSSFSTLTGEALAAELDTFIKAANERYAVQAKERLERNAKFLKDAFVFMADSGPVLLTPDYKCVQFLGSEFVIHQSVDAFQDANNRNRRWDRVESETEKVSLVGPYLDKLIPRLVK